ncbi:Uma2 family endonuclease [Kitasatospora sp. NPDC008050]|uniref:Uma2 family endonuclease n=1 Tax=Kitasatospora sp. NPDC008050 TaxID=3364021 RepID=UPI0036E55CB3
MSEAAIAHFPLPDFPYVMWLRGELADWLRVPKNVPVEVIAGDVVVSPGRTLAHAVIVGDFQQEICGRGIADSRFPWRAIQLLGLDLAGIGDGYIPDLLVLHQQIEAEGWAGAFEFPRADQVELVMEVTARASAHDDREPVQGCRATKWNGYARCGVPHYLLIDRDPKRPGITLYGNPDRFAGRYEELRSWKFGEPVRLPEPFDVELRTELWRPWED